MTRGEAINWIINLTADIGKCEHQDLWHYEQALEDIRDMIEALSSAQSELQTAIQEILDYLDNVLHPLVSPDHWNVYSDLYDMVEQLSTNCGADMRGEQNE